MSNLKTYLAPALALALLVSANPVLAKGRGDEAMRDALFTQADANADGSVTLEELAAAQQAAFAKADTNADGSLDKTEREVQMIAQATEMVKARLAAGDRMDGDEDGLVTLSEFTSRDDRFARLDDDGDGAISKAEFEDAGRGHGRGRNGRDHDNN